MTNYPKLTILNLINGFLNTDNNKLLAIFLIILSFSMYIRIIMIPEIISNINGLSNFTYKFVLLFIIYNIFEILYKKVSFKYIVSTQDYIYKKLLGNLLKKQREEISGIAPQSVFINIVLWAKEFSWLFIIFFQILPLISAFFLTYLFILKNFNFVLSFFYLLTVLLQLIVIHKKNKNLEDSGSEYNNLRNIFINHCQDMNINMESILNGENINNEIKNMENKIDNYQIKIIKNFDINFSIQFLTNLIIILFMVISIMLFKNISTALLVKYILVHLGTHTFFLNKINDFTILITYIGKLKNGLEDINKYSVYSEKKNISKKSFGLRNHISLRNIEFSYNKKINNTNNFIFIRNLDIEFGKITVLIGKIGSGKSTLLKILFGLLDVDLGNIYVDEKKLESKDKWRNDIFYVKQKPVLFNRSMTENIFYPNTKNKSNINKIKEIGMFDIYQELIKKENNMGIAGENLSGGQKQIINLFRSLLSKKNIILLDEPTSSLDEKNRNIIYKMIKLMKKLNKTVIISTHDNDLINYSDRIITLENGNIIKN